MIKIPTEELCGKWIEYISKSDKVMVEDHLLYSKIEKMKNMLQKREWKYYHLQSVENFIYHLKSIKNERTREKISHEIDNYIELALTKVENDSRLIDKGKELAPFVWKLSDTYKYEVGFIQKPDILTTSILVIGLFVLLKISLSTLNALLICILVFSIYTLYGYFKKRSRKVY